MKHVLSLSYGKDSLACLGAIEQLGWPLDRIVHAEIWATDTIPADLPPMVEFKAKADEIIKERYGIQVEHVSSGTTFEKVYHRKKQHSRIDDNGNIYGWPGPLKSWCVKELKIKATEKAYMPYGRRGDIPIVYLGIAADEPARFHNLTNNQRSPLVEIGWTEKECREWCENNGLLSPIYTEARTRGGCWFCPKQNNENLRMLRRDYPDYWALMLKWDAENNPRFSFDSSGHSLHDFERRFQMEDEGLVPTDRRFRWSMIK